MFPNGGCVKTHPPFLFPIFIDGPPTQTSFSPTNIFSARIDKICFGGSLVMSVKSRVRLASLPGSIGWIQNSKYPSVPVGRERPSVSLAGSRPTIPRRLSQAAWFRAGSAPTSSRIIFHAAMLSAPSGGGPIARETEHCGQKQIRFAVDFCRGLTPTVWANMYTATDLCPASISRLQRRQDKFSKGLLPLRPVAAPESILSASWPEGKCVERFPQLRGRDLKSIRPAQKRLVTQGQQ